MITPRVFGNLPALHEALRNRLVDQFKGGMADTGPFCVMLSGGQTPMPIYRAIALHPCPVSPNLHLCLSDERLVPWDSPSSNYGNITPMIRALQLPNERVLAVNTTKPMEAAATQYDTDLSSFARRGGKMRLGLLGLGDDGHTASLFSAADVTSGQGKMALGVKRPTPPNRVSVSSDFIGRFAEIVVVAAGKGKKAMAKTLLTSPRSIPAGLVLAQHPHAELWMDEEAST